MKTGLWAVSQKRKEVAPFQHQKLASLHSDRISRSWLGIEQGDFAVQLARPDDVEHQFLAVSRVGADFNTPGDNGHHAIAGITLTKNNVVCGVAHCLGIGRELVQVVPRQIAEEEMAGQNRHFIRSFRPAH